MKWRNLLLYSETSNFAFFLCHSNANHSICMALETLMDREHDYSWDWENRSEYGYKHVSPSGLLSTDSFNFKEIIGDEWYDLKKITTVRNPWSRLYDFYTWHFTIERPIKKIEQKIYDFTISKSSFDEWISSLEKDKTFDWWGEIFNQEIMRRHCNYVIRYEYLNEDINNIFPGLKIPSASVSHPGQWYAEDNKYLMTIKTKNIINYFCKEDIINYEYTYDGEQTLS